MRAPIWRRAEVGASARTHDPARVAVSLAASAVAAIVAAALAIALIVLLGVNPYTAAASTMQQHGAMHRSGAVSIVSHRGAAALAPENTLAAARIGMDTGVEFVEADAQLTRDGVPVLMHDDTIDRTTNGTGRVGDHTLAQLRALDAGGWFGSEYRGEQVPTLEEFLDELASSNIRALVELKGEWPVVQIEAVADMLQSRHLVNAVALQSFDEETLLGLQQAAPSFARVMLTREWNERTAELAVELEVSAVGGRPKLLEEDPDLIGSLREAGIGLLAYTLNKEPLWDDAIAHDIDLIVTDDPAHLERWRSDHERALRGTDNEAGTGKPDADGMSGAGAAAAVGAGSKSPRAMKTRARRPNRRDPSQRHTRPQQLCQPVDRQENTRETASAPAQPDSTFLSRRRSHREAARHHTAH